MRKVFHDDFQREGGRVGGSLGRRNMQKVVIVRSVFVAVMLMMFSPATFGQALPTAEAAPVSIGFALPRTAGTLQYAVSASESLVWGYYGNSGPASSTNLSGDLAYLSNSKRSPFSMVFAGGHSWSTSSQPSFSFFSLGLSQVANLGRWNFLVSDNVTYTPSTPTTGLAGILGVGDLGLNPVQVGVDNGQGVLTNYSTRVGNIVAGSVQRQLTGRTSINASGSYSIMRFLSDRGSSDFAGLDSNSTMGGGGISHQIDARNTVGGNYSYSTYNFSGTTPGIPAPGFVSQTASAQYSRQFSRKFVMSASAGPQWTTVDSARGMQNVSLFADVSGEYAGQFSHMSLIFVRGTNSGFGVTGGSSSDSVAFSASRTFDRVWNAAATSSYTRTQSLVSPVISPFSFNTTVAGVQVSRAIARSLSAYASYTLQNQSSKGAAAFAVDAFSGLSHVVGIGLTYSPMSIHFGRP